MKTLVYVGANVGSSLSGMVHKYDKVYAFEPDPEMFEALKTNLSKYSWVTLVNAACAEDNGKIKFYITPNRVSSSVSIVSTLTHPEDHPQRNYTEIEVNTINLLDFLKENEVEHIDYYLSDAQGSDLAILKTIKEFVDDKKISELYIETHGDGKYLYDELNNQFKEFKKILSENYEFVHASLGRLYGKIVSEKEIPEDEYEWDSYWRLK